VIEGEPGVLRGFPCNLAEWTEPGTAPLGLVRPCSVPCSDEHHGRRDPAREQRLWRSAEAVARMNRQCSSKPSGQDSIRFSSSTCAMGHSAHCCPRRHAGYRTRGFRPTAGGWRSTRCSPVGHQRSPSHPSREPHTCRRPIGSRSASPPVIHSGRATAICSTIAYIPECRHQEPVLARGFDPSTGRVTGEATEVLTRGK
jgi:hypothetical protein